MVEDKEDEIEREYRRIKERNESHRSSVDSLMGEKPRGKKLGQPGEVDGFLQKIVQPMQAKKKEELLKGGEVGKKGTGATGG